MSNSIPNISSTAGTSALLFSFGDLTIRVESSDSSTLEWLEEFFTPHFHVSHNGHAHVTIILTLSDKRFDELSARAATGALIDCFALDSGVVQLPEWNSVDHNTAIFDHTFKLFYLVSPDRTRVEIVARRDNEKVRTPVMRVLREYAMIHAQTDQEGVFLHASAIAAGNRGVVITGAKASGKTTLLTYLLQRPNVRYIANDRVLLSADDKGPMIRGMPAIITIRPDMLGRFPSVQERLLSGNYSHRKTLQETATAARPTRPWSDSRYGLTPRQYCQLLGTTPVASAKLAALLFPRVTRQPGGISLLPLDKQQALQRIRASLLGTYDWEKSHELFRVSGADAVLDRATLEKRCDELISHSRCFECQLGLQAYENPARADLLIEALSNQGALPA